MSTPSVSIVIATYQRCTRLQRCIAAVRRNVTIPHEIVVVDGGSTDGSTAWLAAQPDVRLHVETQRGGCCLAYDLGLRMARAPLVMWLNDDSYPLAGSVAHAAALLDRPDMQDVGILAFYHTHDDPWNELHGFDQDGHRWSMMHVRGVPYANFGLLRRSVLEQVGFLDTDYRFCAWDPDLSLKVQREAGLLVLSSPRALVYHEEVADERKQADAGAIRTADNERLFRKWNLPPKGEFPDPRPAYLALLRARGLV
jgi:GT2 family glycosyltransferase